MSTKGSTEIFFTIALSFAVKVFDQRYSTQDEELSKLMSELNLFDKHFSAHYEKLHFHYV